MHGFLILSPFHEFFLLRRVTDIAHLQVNRHHVLMNEISQFLSHPLTILTGSKHDFVTSFSYDENIISFANWKKATMHDVVPPLVISFNPI